ncbi:guanylate kinase [Blochmannia endosymbiont of Camponotus (Colobopsis) obliquus]|uniref:guanylate kinase n=1 Tax=Blochmannia endosymbiont of Camponotus (Colobopsis) obliquus TaxID=1505597 RepID=UPI00061A8166|nr:guanylate kinase [Blochmannia endosymbiont of Camponotus (Colobopsis) obliquus]AKC60757.1 guanylate kinase [Blochmannia endosymbiont of Camponotus (Colobopsis) obliquus]
MNKGILYIISAPSGTGKSTLINSLIQKNTSFLNIHMSISYTTRNIRPGEINGKHYYFIPISNFKKMIEKKVFLEYTQTFNHYYGSSKQSIESALNNGINLILNIDWKGAQQIRNTSIKTCSIFLLPPSKKELERRLRNRNLDNEKMIIKRIKYAMDEVKHLEEYDYLIINDNFNSALNNLKHIICAEKLKILHKKPIIINKLIN